MKTIKQAITGKGNEVASIEPDANAVEAIKKLSEKYRLSIGDEK